MQSAIEQFADKPGADGRSGGGDEADIKSNNPHLTGGENDMRIEKLIAVE